MPTLPPPTQPRRIQERPRERSPLLPLLAVAIGVHVLIALGLAWVLSHHLAPPPEDTLDVNIDVSLGEAVQKLVASEASTTDTPPPPTPPDPTPPPESPKAEPPPEPPPIAEKPEFPEPPPATPKPQPVKREQTQPKRPSATPAPAAPRTGAKVGATPQAGVAGGNVDRGATSGTPGGAKIGNSGWLCPNDLGYPRAALISRIEGTVTVRVRTDATGRVVSVDVLQSSNPIFSAHARQSIPGRWKGPPNSTLPSKLVKYQLR